MNKYYYKHLSNWEMGALNYTSLLCLIKIILTNKFLVRLNGLMI